MSKLVRAVAVLQNKPTVAFTYWMRKSRRTQRSVPLSNMPPFAKRLEFRAVDVMACEDEVIPLQSGSNPLQTMQDWRRGFTTPKGHFFIPRATRARIS